VLAGAAFVVQALASARQVSPCAMVLAPLLAQRFVERFGWGARATGAAAAGRFLAVNWAVLVFLVSRRPWP